MAVVGGSQAFMTIKLNMHHISNVPVGNPALLPQHS